MVAITIATMVMYHVTNIIFYKYLSFILITILSAIMLILTFKTIKAIAARSLCVEE